MKDVKRRPPSNLGRGGIALAASLVLSLMLPKTALAESCSSFPDRFNYDLSTALILWPAIALVAYDVFLLVRPFLYLHQRRFVIWGLTVPYLLFAIYALFAQIPKDSLQAYITAVIAWPPFVIAAYGLYRLSKRLYAAYPRRYVAGVMTFPYVIAGSYFVFKSETPFLLTVLVCGAIGFAAVKVHTAEFKFSPPRRFILHFAIVMTLLTLASASRPTCCPAVRMREIRAFYFECSSCLCRDTPKPVTLGPHEIDLEERASNGDATAQFDLGRFYFENSYTQDDDRKGLEWLLKAAAGGNREAQKQLGAGGYGYVQGPERKKWKDMSVAPGQKEP